MKKEIQVCYSSFSLKKCSEYDQNTLCTFKVVERLTPRQRRFSTKNCLKAFVADANKGIDSQKSKKDLVFFQ